MPVIIIAVQSILELSWTDLQKDYLQPRSSVSKVCEDFVPCSRPVAWQGSRWLGCLFAGALERHRLSAWIWNAQPTMSLWPLFRLSSIGFCVAIGSRKEFKIRARMRKRWENWGVSESRHVRWIIATVLVTTAERALSVAWMSSNCACIICHCYLRFIARWTCHQ